MGASGHAVTDSYVQMLLGMRLGSSYSGGAAAATIGFSFTAPLFFFVFCGAFAAAADGLFLTLAAAAFAATACKEDRKSAQRAPVVMILSPPWRSDHYCRGALAGVLRRGRNRDVGNVTLIALRSPAMICLAFATLSARASTLKTGFAFPEPGVAPSEGTIARVFATSPPAAGPVWASVAGGDSVAGGWEAAAGCWCMGGQLVVAFCKDSILCAPALIPCAPALAPCGPALAAR